MIFISAGHHKNAQGAKFKEYSEYFFTSPWADFIAELLEGEAVRVPNGTLKDKVNFINETAVKGDLAIEIHFNSAKLWRDGNANGVIDDGEMVHVGRGSETLYYPSSITGKEAALTVQSALGSLMKPNRGVKEGWYQMNKSKGADFFLTRTRCTSLIIEPEFIDNVLKIQTNKIDACHVIASALLECVK